MQRQQLIVAASSSSGPLLAWDAATGTTEATFKDTACPANGLALLGTKCLLATQRNAPAVHTNAWGQESRLQRSFLQENMTAIAASLDGTYVAAGGSSGSIYLWTAADGCLVAVWPAHFKAVTCLAFADGGAVLVSGAEDTLVCVWLLSEVLRLPTGPHTDIAAAHTWSAHILPVTGMCVGAGVSEPIVATVSLDRNCNIHSLASGLLLRTMALLGLLHSLAMDPAEHRIFLGMESGDIAQASLTAPPSTSSSASGLPGDLPSLQGHVGPVYCLAVTPDGAMLASGAADGTMRVWDIISGQAMRVLTHPAKGPVTSLLCLSAPAVLSLPSSDRSAGPAFVCFKGSQPPALMQQLAKFKQVAASEAWCSPPVTLGLNSSQLWSAGHTGHGAYGRSDADVAVGISSESQQQQLGLQEKLAATQSELQQWRTLHQELHAFCTDSLLSMR